MTAITYDDISNLKSQLVRKGLNGGFHVAPITADPISTISAAGGDIQALPAGYRSVGYLSTDGIALSVADTETDISAWQSSDPIRSDITKRTTTAKLTGLETNATIIALCNSVDLDSLSPNPTTGELQILTPSTPTKRYYRAAAIAVDATDAGEIWMVRFFPRMSATAIDDQTFSNGDNPIEWGVTLQAYPDPDLGYATASIFGGPGWLPLVGDMGFDDSSS